MYGQLRGYEKKPFIASCIPEGLSFTASTGAAAGLQDLGKFIFGDHTISVGIEDPEGSPHDFTPGKFKVSVKTWKEVGGFSRYIS